MSFTDQEQKEIRTYCAFLLKEYGFDISPGDPIIPALYIIHKEMQLNNENNRMIGLIVKEASAKINPTVFHFVSPGEAFKFQLGAGVKWLIISIPVVLLVWICAWTWSAAGDVENARTIISASVNVRELLKRAKLDEQGYYFIDFTMSKGDSVRHFKEFQKVDTKTIRVYLGKKK